MKRNYSEGRTMSSTELSSLKGSGKRLVHSPWVSAVSAHLLSRGADDFGSGLLFQGFCLVKTWKIGLVCSSGAQARFVYCPVK